MKVYETHTVTKEEKRLLCRKCDLCGYESKHNRYPEMWDGTEDNNTRETEIIVQIRMKEGDTYPEGSWGTDFEVDLCPRCFRDKLIPWLRSQGARVEEKEYYW